MHLYEQKQLHIKNNPGFKVAMMQQHQREECEIKEHKKTDNSYKYQQQSKICYGCEDICEIAR